jgi:sarcosine oxidase, subunit alpha
MVKKSGSRSDVGYAGMIGKTKPDFVSEHALTRKAFAEQTNRKQLVGLLTDDPALVFDEGVHIVADPAQLKPMTMLGQFPRRVRPWASTLPGRSTARSVPANAAGSMA